jgi:hypothetical protein
MSAERGNEKKVSSSGALKCRETTVEELFNAVVQGIRILDKVVGISINLVPTRQRENPVVDAPASRGNE